MEDVDLISHVLELTVVLIFNACVYFALGNTTKELTDLVCACGCVQMHMHLALNACEE